MSRPLAAARRRWSIDSDPFRPVNLAQVDEDAFSQWSGSTDPFGMSGSNPFGGHRTFEPTIDDHMSMRSGASSALGAFKQPADLRSVDVHKLKIPAMKRTTDDTAKNSHMQLNSLLRTLSVFNAAYGIDICNPLQSEVNSSTPSS